MKSSTRRLRLGVTPWTHDGADPLRDLIRQARFAESLGFDSFFLPESHLHPGARPAPLVALAAIAGATERIRLGTTSLLLPLRHPLLLAEEVATLDRISGGRLILGLGRGFHRATFEAFGVDPRTKRDRFEEVLATMLRAWGVEPWWDGAPEPLEGGVPRVEPRPLQEPHPPLWMAAFGPKAIDQAARLRLPYFASPMEPMEVVEANLARWQAATGAAHPVALMRTVLVSSDPAELSAAGQRLLREAESLGSRFRRRAAGPEWPLVGVPDRVTEAVGALRERLDLGHLVLRPAAPADRDRADQAVAALAELLRIR